MKICICLLDYLSYNKVPRDQPPLGEKKNSFISQNINHFILFAVESKTIRVLDIWVDVIHTQIVFQN